MKTKSSVMYGKKNSVEIDDNNFDTAIAWTRMHWRCLDLSPKTSKIYYDRGIKVCSEWSGHSGLERFIKDMGLKPEGKYSIDRIDNSKGYSPDNCRWADTTTQLVNRRTFKNNKLGQKNINPDNGGYKVIMRRYGKVVYQKRFADLAKAIAARDEALLRFTV